MIINALISGGQTGADQGGLFAAVVLGIPTGGYAPEGWRTEAGPAPWLGEDYNLIECSDKDYRVRTEFNVKNSDGTVIFGKRSAGSNYTEETCRILGKPKLWIWWPEMVQPGVKTEAKAFNPLFRLWVRRYNIHTLNVAGNRESKNPGIQEFTKQFLLEALK